MAFTQIYLTRAFSILEEALTPKGLWGADPVPGNQKLLPNKAQDDSSETTFNRSETSDVDGFTVLSYTGVSGPLSAQTISGTVDILTQVDVSDADGNMHWFVHIWVTVGDTDVVRGTLLANYEEALGVNEWPTTLTGIAFNSAQTLTDVAIQEGDRIVVELGYIARNTLTASRTGGVRAGGDSASVDCTLGATATDRIGFLTFSNPITTPDPPDNDECADATDVGTAPVTVEQNTEWATEDGADPVLPNAGIAPFGSVWFTFTPDATATYVIDTEGSDYDTLLAVFTGSCGSLVLVDEDDESGSGSTSALSLPLTNGVPYTILVGSWDGGGGNLRLNIAVAAPPSAPTLSVTTILSSAVTLSWPAVSPVSFYKIERCEGAGCSGFAEIATVSPNGPPVTKSIGGMTPGQTYRFRVRGFHNIQGNGDYSNIVEVTLLSGTTGLTQVAFAFGAEGTFGRTLLVHQPPSSPAGGRWRAHFALDNLMVGIWATYDGGVFPECGSSDLLVRYRVQGLGEQEELVPGVWVKGQYIDETANNQVRYCAFHQKIEMRGRFGSVDSLTNTHLADGYLEVRLNEEVVFRVDDIALGNQGTAGYDRISFNPGGLMTTDPSPETPPPPGYILENGGAQWFYFNATDVYGRGHPSAVYNFDFATMTDEDLFGDPPSAGLGPFVRMNNFGGIQPSWPAPRIWDGGSILPDGGLTTLQHGSPPEEGGVDNAGMVSLELDLPVEPPETPPSESDPPSGNELPCPCPPPGGPPSLGPTPEPPIDEPLPPLVPQCTFGGLMPDGNDTVQPESWL